MRAPKRDRARTGLTLATRRHGKALPPIDCGPTSAAYAQLDQKREALERRLERLQPAIKARKGWKNARTLLGSSYIRSSLAARVALLEAADFLIRVLEMMPPS